jgi:glycosyltransferase involved in cell wall biosynthesis
LFQETRPVVGDVARSENFWAVEGIACYMESLAQHEGYYTLGGMNAGRMPAARHRLLEDNFYVPLAQLVRAHGLEDLVEVLGPLPHGRSLSLMKGADVALLFGQSGREDLASVPAKVYEYIGAGKAVLAVGAGAEVCSLLRKGGCRLWEALTSGELAAAVEEILGEYVAGRRGWGGDPAARQSFTRQQMTQEIQAILEQVLRVRRRTQWA